jgi:fimbrial chaperone protein
MKTVMKRSILISLFFSALALFPLHASAFELSPMEMEYVSGSGQYSKTFFIENKGSSPVAAQIRVYRRESDSAGEEVRTDTQDFVVFPQQVMLGANEKRAVRVVYKGTAPATQEQAYRLIAEQLPLTSDPTIATDAKVQIKYLLKFVASIYVSPKSGGANVVVDSIAPQGERLQLSLANKGNKHKTLKGARVLLTGQGRTVELSSASLSALDKVNLLPGSKATVLVNRPANLPTGQLDTEVRFE